MADYCLKKTFFKVVAGARDIHDRNDGCKQVQTVEKSYKPNGFERWSVSTDIIILVMYEPFIYTACGVKPVKLAPPKYKIGEYG